MDPRTWLEYQSDLISQGVDWDQIGEIKKKWFEDMMQQEPYSGLSLQDQADVGESFLGPDDWARHAFGTLQDDPAFRSDSLEDRIQAFDEVAKPTSAFHQLAPIQREQLRNNVTSVPSPPEQFGPPDVTGLGPVGAAVSSGGFVITSLYRAAKRAIAQAAEAEATAELATSLEAGKVAEKVGLPSWAGILGAVASRAAAPPETTIDTIAAARQMEQNAPGEGIVQAAQGAFQRVAQNKSWEKALHPETLGGGLEALADVGASMVGGIGEVGTALASTGLEASLAYYGTMLPAAKVGGLVGGTAGEMVAPEGGGGPGMAIGGALGMGASNALLGASAQFWNTLASKGYDLTKPDGVVQALNDEDAVGKAMGDAGKAGVAAGAVGTALPVFMGKFTDAVLASAGKETGSEAADAARKLVLELDPKATARAEQAARDQLIIAGRAVAPPLARASAKLGEMTAAAGIGVAGEAARELTVEGKVSPASLVETGVSFGALPIAFELPGMAGKFLFGRAREAGVSPERQVWEVKPGEQSPGELPSLEYLRQFHAPKWLPDEDAAKWAKGELTDEQITGDLERHLKPDYTPEQVGPSDAAAALRDSAEVSQHLLYQGRVTPDKAKPLEPTEADRIAEVYARKSYQNLADRLQTTDPEQAAQVRENAPDVRAVAARGGVQEALARSIEEHFPGRRVVYMDLKGMPSSGLPSPEGTLVLDANLSDAQLVKGVGMEELLHSLQASHPEAFDALSEKVKAAAPDFYNTMKERLRGSYAEERIPISEEQLDREVVPNMARQESTPIWQAFGDLVGGGQTEPSVVKKLTSAARDAFVGIADALGAKPEGMEKTAALEKVRGLVAEFMAQGRGEPTEQRVAERRVQEGTPPAGGPEQRVAERRTVDQMTPEEMKAALLTDATTGGPNDRAFMEAVQREGHTHAAMSDMDLLKTVNDNLGHPAGDALLREFHRVSQEVADQFGLKVYRTGGVRGDEFAAPGNEELTRAYKEAIDKRLAEHEIEVEGNKGGLWTVEVRASTAVGELNREATSVSKTLARAGEAVQAEKDAREAAGLRSPRGEFRGVRKAAQEVGAEGGERPTGSEETTAAAAAFPDDPASRAVAEQVQADPATVAAATLGPSGIGPDTPPWALNNMIGRGGELVNQIPVPKLWDSVRTTWQRIMTDRRAYLAFVQGKIMGTMNPIEAADLSLSMDNWSAQLHSEMTKFHSEFIEPLERATKFQPKGVPHFTAEDAETFVVARHVPEGNQKVYEDGFLKPLKRLQEYVTQAQERVDTDPTDSNRERLRVANERLASLIDTEPDQHAWSGIHNDEAVRRLNDLEKRGLIKIERVNPDDPTTWNYSGPLQDSIGKLVEAASEYRLGLRKKYGLNTDDELDAFRRYRYYVPLLGEGEDFDPDEPWTKRLSRKLSGQPQIEPYYRQEEYRVGRTNEPKQVLAHMVADTERLIWKARRNKALQPLNELANQFGNVMNDKGKPIFEFIKAGEHRYYNPKTGEISTTKGFDHIRGDPSVFHVMVDGQWTPIRINHARFASALSNLGPETMGVFMGHINAFTRAYSRMLTQLNIEFPLGNKWRHMTEAAINIGGQEYKGIQARTVALQAEAARTVWKAQRQMHTGGFKPETPMDFHYAEMKEHGGSITYAGFHEVEALYSKWCKDLRDATTTDKAMEVWHKIVNLAEDANMTAGDSTRLAIYAALREGASPKASPEKAALLARRAGIDFTRKGEIVRFLGPLYLFANANIQGASMVLKSWYRSGAVKAICGGMFLGGWSHASLMRRTMGHDDTENVDNWDKFSENLKQSSILFPLGSPDKFGRVPLPYGYSTAWYAGAVAEAVQHGRKTPLEAALDISSSIASAWCPVGHIDLRGGDKVSAIQALTPWVGRAPLDITLNRNAFGNPIQPATYPSSAGVSIPAHDNFFHRTGVGYQKVAEMLSNATDFEKTGRGLIDFSPDSIRYWVDWMTPGTLSSIKDGMALALSRFEEHKATDLPDSELQKVPIIRRFTYEVPEWSASSRFHADSQLAAIRWAHFKDLAEKSPDDARGYAKQYANTLALGEKVPEFNRALAELRKAGDERAMLNLQKKFIRLYFLAYDKDAGK